MTDRAGFCAKSFTDMSRFTRIEVALKMYDTGLVPIFYHDDETVATRVVRACYDAGARVFEYTNRGDLAHEVFSQIRRMVVDEMPDLALGVGSIVDASTAALFVQMGADFVVSPVLNPDMARLCNRRKVLWIPGCGTVSEISHAEELGAEIVKIFPARQVGGPGFIRAVRGPCPWTRIMPAGGVEPEAEDLRSWFEAGAACVGMGSKLFGTSFYSEGDLAEIQARVASTLDAIRRVRA